MKVGAPALKEQFSEGQAAKSTAATTSRRPFRRAAPCVTNAERSPAC